MQAFSRYIMRRMKKTPSKPTKRTLGTALKEFRERAALSQGELARRSGVGQSNISRIELDPRPDFGVQTLIALADALGVAPEEILIRGLTHRVQREDPFIDEVVALTRLCNAGERGVLQGVFAFLAMNRRSGARLSLIPISDEERREP